MENRLNVSACGKTKAKQHTQCKIGLALLVGRLLQLEILLSYGLLMSKITVAIIIVSIELVGQGEIAGLIPVQTHLAVLGVAN